MPTVEFKNPIKRGDEEITEVEIREPSAGEMRGLRLGDLMNADIDSVSTLLTRVTNPALQKHEIAALKASDIANVTGELLSFFMDAG